MLFLSQEQQVEMLRPFTENDVKMALFFIPGDKSPGPDGFRSGFYKDSWSVIGADVTRPVLDFFETERLLKQVNAIVLTFIPEVKCPRSVTEYRPIVCCNVIYKCITKLMCLRIKEVLPVIIVDNQ